MYDGVYNYPITLVDDADWSASLVYCRGWLDKQIHMNANAMVVYTYLRVMGDHLDPNLNTLRAKEAKFCHAILTSRVC